MRQFAAGKRSRGIAADPAGRVRYVSDAASASLLELNGAGSVARP